MAKSYEETWGHLDWRNTPDEKLAKQVKGMVKDGADVNAKAYDGRTALMLAAAWGGTEAVKALVKAGADVNATDEDGLTALMEAALNGCTETVKALVELGADIEAKDEYGDTALMKAARYANTETVKALVEAADKLKNAVESRAQGDKDNTPKTRAEVRQQLAEVEAKKQQLVNSLRENDPEHETRQALAKKLKQIREDYSPAEALDAAEKNKTVQALRQQLKSKGGTR